MLVIFSFVKVCLNILILIEKVIAEMTNGGVDRSVECTGSIQAMISAFECVHDVNDLFPKLNVL